MDALTSNTFNIPLAPAPSLPPVCFVCNNRSRRLVTRSSNRNGNAGRPYHKSQIIHHATAASPAKLRSPARTAVVLVDCIMYAGWALATTMLSE
ncbi:hypothetical protein FVEG_09337 [Fusarium verticillioides 7600]|uniref:GRF-like zinc ribbon domain-containing protein n=1 Tax=Gibberella moniliformis (strain M3125 / FGSC 7600) TaxID=334819 RepID=W7MQV9_GIBM7|nr:hypothetical protein FVEG_09337 [Fusarium verticillioides 7600]EWG50000.1 hypothetical protein FVEG_09337 [Fusarium verticillioides 7600]